MASVDDRVPPLSTFVIVWHKRRQAQYELNLTGLTSQVGASLIGTRAPELNFLGLR